MNPTDIRKQYFRSWFIVDLASSIPFDMLVSKVKILNFYNLLNGARSDVYAHRPYFPHPYKGTYRTISLNYISLAVLINF